FASGRLCLGRFRIERPLGTRAESTAYLAVDVVSGGETVVRATALAADADHAQAARAAAPLAALELPGVAALVALGVEETEDGARLVTVRPFVAGETLAERVGRRPLGAEATAALGVR